MEAKNMKSHPLIDEFIPAIEGEDGICYTHPEKLLGVTRDGLSKHFFHRPSKAYTTGTRKRRKIQNECDLQGGETLWHKPVMVNGKQKGCKKILVLYTNFGKNRKLEKTNWVMHQYHLGQHEEEKGEVVVSKIFYQTQPRQCNWSNKSAITGEGSGEPNNNSTGRRDSGSRSCSSKEIVTHRYEMSVVVGVPPMTSFTTHDPLDIQQLKLDHFSFIPFKKTFDEISSGNNNNTLDRFNNSITSFDMMGMGYFPFQHLNYGPNMGLTITPNNTPLCFIPSSTSSQMMSELNFTMFHSMFPTHVKPTVSLHSNNNNNNNPSSISSDDVQN
ncbi:hypothetical protein JHK82_012587 [Glycine max]|nr:hypothetical protein JHK86_012601 [Glycine max]KAG5154618.1 hypothetical protein JHK82_012587 [Glycine max]KAH1250133.1 NAC domain-containing protein 75 [Glycine max]